MKTKLTTAKKRPQAGQRRALGLAICSRLVRYNSASDDQIRWGSNDDPRTVLTPGQTYTVKSKEVHSWHTKLELVEHPGLRFNSVHFSSANTPDHPRRDT